MRPRRARLGPQGSGHGARPERRTGQERATSSPSSTRRGCRRSSTCRSSAAVLLGQAGADVELPRACWAGQPLNTRCPNRNLWLAHNENNMSLASAANNGVGLILGLAALPRPVPDHLRAGGLRRRDRGQDGRGPAPVPPGLPQRHAGGRRPERGRRRRHWETRPLNQKAPRRTRALTGRASAWSCATAPTTPVARSRSSRRPARCGSRMTVSAQDHGQVINPQATSGGSQGRRPDGQPDLARGGARSTTTPRDDPQRRLGDVPDPAVQGRPRASTRCSSNRPEYPATGAGEGACCAGRRRHRQRGLRRHRRPHPPAAAATHPREGCARRRPRQA